MVQEGVLLKNRYQILEKSGKGGSGTVWKVRDERLDLIVGVKEIHMKEKFHDDKIMSGLFKNEIEIMKSLNYPGLPTFYDAFQMDNKLFIVMSYIEGESLARLIQTQGAQEQKKVIEWGKQLCDILMYLHNHIPPIIYGDLKPANIILHPSGQLTLIDFGSAFELGKSDSYHLVTHGFSPPEQYSGIVDVRSDIYALGMTLYQLITGVSIEALSVELKPISQINSAVDKKFEWMIKKCIQMNPDMRYQSVKALKDDLNSLSDEKEQFMFRSAISILKKIGKRKETKRIFVEPVETYDSEIVEYNAELLLRLQNPPENTKW